MMQHSLELVLKSYILHLMNFRFTTFPIVSRYLCEYGMRHIVQIVLGNQPEMLEIFYQVEDLNSNY